MYFSYKPAISKSRNLLQIALSDASGKIKYFNCRTTCSATKWLVDRHRINIIALLVLVSIAKLITRSLVPVGTLELLTASQ